MVDFLQRLKKLVRPLIPRAVMEQRRRQGWRRLASASGLHLVIRDIFFDLERGDKVLRIRSSHGFYLPHMIENFDYYISSVVPLRVQGKMLVDMSGPRYHRLQGFSDIPLLFPSHTEPYGTTAEYLDFAGLSEGQIVLDIGAYSAVTSIIFAGLVGPSGHVYAFEADHTNYECAALNVEMAQRWMGLKNITLLHTAIWSHEDGVMFSNEGAMGSSAVAITGGGRGLETKTPSTTLEGFCRKQGLDRVDFIKVDIEGGEIEMLRNSVGFLSRMKTKLIVEPHMVAGSMSTKTCCELLESAGYAVRIRGQVGESAAMIEAVAVASRPAPN
jgi:FkbM family methyltransferase